MVVGGRLLSEKNSCGVERVEPLGSDVHAIEWSLLQGESAVKHFKKPRQKDTACFAHER